MAFVNKLKKDDDILNAATINPTTGLKVGTTPTPTGDSKIRDVINSYGGSKYGLSDSMIGWDGKNKSVLLNNESLMQAGSIGSDNRAYAKEDMIKSAIDNYAKSKGLAGTAPANASLSTQKSAAPSAYSSPYSAKIDSILNGLMDTKSFAYDPESDPVFQALKGQYGAAGDKALANTMSEASSMSGGRLNSWATTAGMQAKSGFDQQLMSQVPALADTAYNRHQGDINNREQLLNAIMNVDSADYSKFSDARNFDRGVLESDRGFDRGVLESDRGYNRGILESDRNFGYTKETDAKNFNRGVLESDRNFNYQVGRDKILDGQWMKQFSAEEKQRIVSNGLQSRQISISEANAALNRAEFGYRKETDAKEWKFKVEQAAKEAKADVDVLGSQYADMMKSGDPEAWITENAPYMTKDELKALKSLAPEIDTLDSLLKNKTQIDKK